jgi:hypothetical protein
MLKPLNLSKFLAPFATCHLDDGRLKFHINLTDQTPLNPHFALKCPQTPTQPTGNTTF